MSQPNLLTRACGKITRWRDDTYWRSLAGAQNGRRCFVVGNGPSLRVEDLARLEGEVTIASNKIYLAFDKTTWRPTHFTVADRLVWEKVRAEIHRHFSRVLIPDYIERNANGIAMTAWRDLGHASVDPDPTGGFCPDATKGLYGGATVTYYNMQLAAHLGCSSIYLIGCDHYYAGEKDVKAEQVVAAPATSNHFDPRYRAPGEIVNPAPIELMNAAFVRGRVYSDHHKLPIFNATRGGHLEAFKRVDLDQVLASKV